MNKNNFIFLLLIILIFSCSKDKSQITNGFWFSDNTYTSLYFKNDTLFLFPEGEKFRFNEVNSEIVLIERLNLIEPWKIDTLKLPFIFGKINNQGYVLKNKWHSNQDSLEFIKLNINNTLTFNRIQLSTTYWSGGFNLEINTAGNSYIQMDGFVENNNCYSFKIDKKEIDEILNLASLVSFNKLEDTFHSNGPPDVSSYSFSFFTDKDTINKYYYGDFDDFSIHPLAMILERNASKYLEDTPKFTKIKPKFFYSKIVQGHFDTSYMISYHEKFDSLNYKLPKYDEDRIRKVFDKYYNFEDDNICYKISINEIGKIIDFEFYDNEILINQKFLEEIKKSVSVTPALFDGQKISLKEFNCISYIMNP